MDISLGIQFFSLSTVIGLVFAVIMHVRHGLGERKAKLARRRH